MEQAIEGWLNLLRLALAARTVEMYGGELRRLAEWAPGRAPGDFTEADLARYLAERRLGSWTPGMGASGHRPEAKSAGLGPSGLAACVAAFRRFFKHVGSTAAARLPFPAREEKVQRTLSDDEVVAVMESCDTSSIYGVRDLAIFMLLWDSGLRASELCGLQTEKVNVEKRVFFVLAKGYKGRRRERFAGFCEHTANQLNHWLAVRPRVALPATTALFCSLGGTIPGTPLTRRGLQNICETAAARAGVQHFSPHAFRRGMSTDSLQAGCPDEVLKKFMGWRTSGMLAIYSRAMTAAAFEGYFPVARLMDRGRKP